MWCGEASNGEHAILDGEGVLGYLGKVEVVAVNEGNAWVLLGEGNATAPPVAGLVLNLELAAKVVGQSEDAVFLNKWNHVLRIPLVEGANQVVSLLGSWCLESSEEYALGPLGSASILVVALYLNLILGVRSEALKGIRIGNGLGSNPLAVLNNSFWILNQEVVEVEAELVGAVEVTDCDVTHLSLECAQVGSVLNIVTLGHSLANELGGEVGNIGVASSRNINCKVLGGKARILTAQPHSEDAIEFNLWRNQPVVGSECILHIACRSHACTVKHGGIAIAINSIAWGEDVPRVAIAIGIDGGPATLGGELAACETILKALNLTTRITGSAVAHVVGLLLAFPINVGSSGSNVGNLYVLNHALSGSRKHVGGKSGIGGTTCTLNNLGTVGASESVGALTRIAAHLPADGVFYAVAQSYSS